MLYIDPQLFYPKGIGEVKYLLVFKAKSFSDGTILKIKVRSFSGVIHKYMKLIGSLPIQPWFNGQPF